MGGYGRPYDIFGSSSSPIDPNRVLNITYTRVLFVDNVVRADALACGASSFSGHVNIHMEETSAVLPLSH